MSPLERSSIERKVASLSSTSDEPNRAVAAGLPDSAETPRQLLRPIELSGSRLPQDESRQQARHRHLDLLIDTRASVDLGEMHGRVQAYAAWAVDLVNHPLTRGIGTHRDPNVLFQTGRPARRKRSTAVYVVASPSCSMP